MSRSILSCLLNIDRRHIISASPAFRRDYASSTKKPTTEPGTAKAKKPRSKVHMLQIENAMLFGKLLETSKERAKTLKLTAAKVRKASAASGTKTDDAGVEANIVKIGVKGTELLEKPVKVRKPKSDKPKKSSKAAESETRDCKTEDVRPKSEPSASHNSEPIQVPVEVIEEKLSWTPIQLPAVKPLTVSHPIDPDAPKLPSVTKILSASMSPEQRAILDRWEKNKIKELGEVGFRRYKQELFLVGREFHANIEEILRGTPEDLLNIRDPIKPLWKSVRHILGSMQEVQVLESFVSHPKLNYCGVVDCIATFRDRLVLIDWKTSEKSKPVVTMTYDTPLQIAAYIGAINADPKYNLEIKEGLIVMAYKSGQISDTYLLTENDIDNYWNQWTKRLELFQAQSQGLQPPIGVGTEVSKTETEISSAK